MRTIAVVLLAVMAFAGCSGNTSLAQTAPAPSETTSAPQHTAGELAAAIGLGEVTVWTAATDENNLLGRPGGYTSAATIVDKRIPCTDPATDCGATIEVFATADQALARSQYIQSILSGGGILGTEYHTLVGPALLRVTGTLTPDQAKVYADKFRAAVDR